MDTRGRLVADLSFLQTGSRDEPVQFEHGVSRVYTDAPDKIAIYGETRL